jgi:hypothetical protein
MRLVVSTHLSDAALGAGGAVAPHRRPAVADAILTAVTRGEALGRAGADAVLGRVSSISTADAPPACASSAASDQESGPAWLPDVAVLIRELLDADDETAELACSPFWQAHPEYPRAQQRTGREALAHMSLQEAA